MEDVKTMQEYFDEFFPLYYARKYDEAIKIQLKQMNWPFWVVIAKTII